MRCEVHPRADGAAAAQPGAPLYYRHPHDPKRTSPVPRQDEMGMDYVPVFGAAGGSELGRTTIVEVLLVLLGGAVVAAAIAWSRAGRVNGALANILALDDPRAHRRPTVEVPKGRAQRACP